MAKKLFENKTKLMQVIYDEHGNKYEVVPGGTVEGEEKVMERYGCLKVVDPKKVAKTDDK
jgi:hypothetical protein